VVITPIQECNHHPQELDKAYANCVKANWGQVGWNLLTPEELVYNIPEADICNSLRYNIGPLTPACIRFVSWAEFFDKAAASEVTHVENKKPQQQHQLQQQQQQIPPMDSSSKGAKRAFNPAICKPGDPYGLQSGQWVLFKHVTSDCGRQLSGLRPTPLVSTEIFNS